MLASRLRFLLLLLVLALSSDPAHAAEPAIQVFFGPKASDGPKGLYFNLMRFLDSAKVSVYGCVHEVDMVAVADRLAAKARAGVDVQLVVEAKWWDNPKNKAARLALERGKVKVFPDTKLSGLMHNKFFVIDKRRVWTGSTNVTESCLLYNPNSSVWVESDKVAANFLAEFEEERAGKFGKRASKPNKSPFPVMTLGSARVRTLFSPEDEPLPKIAEVIDWAKKGVDVMAFVLSSKEISEALVRAHKRGVKVRVLLDNLFSSEAATRRWSYIPARELVKAGVVVKYDDENAKFHHKVILADATTTVVGSFNFSANAAKNNDENLLIIESAEVGRQYQAEFERWWKYYPGDPGEPPLPGKADEDA